MARETTGSLQLINGSCSWSFAILSIHCYWAYSLTLPSHAHTLHPQPCTCVSYCHSFIDRSEQQFQLQNMDGTGLCGVHSLEASHPPHLPLLWRPATRPPVRHTHTCMQGQGLTHAAAAAACVHVRKRLSTTISSVLLQLRVATHPLLTPDCLHCGLVVTATVCWL